MGLLKTVDGGFSRALSHKSTLARLWKLLINEMSLAMPVMIPRFLEALILHAALSRSLEASSPCNATQCKRLLLDECLLRLAAAITTDRDDAEDEPSFDPIVSALVWIASRGSCPELTGY